MKKKSLILVRVTSVVLMFSFLILLSACLNTTSLTVTFDAQNDSPLVEQSIKKGQAVQEPVSPKKVDYVFDGWYKSLSDTQRYSFKTAVNDEMTLYAKWLEALTVTLNTEGGNTISPVVFGEGRIPVAPTAPQKVGFSFAGWYKESNLVSPYDFKEPLSASLTLFAKWQKEMSNEEKVAADLLLINLPSVIVEKVNMPAKGANGSTLTWTTSKSHVLTNKGNVLFGGINAQDQNIEVVVTAKSGTFSDSKTFNLTVGGKQEVVITNSKIVDFISVSDEYIVEDSQIELFFTEGGFLPYVDIESFLNLLDGALESVAGESVNIEGDDGNFYDVIKYMTVEVISNDVVKVTYIAEYSVDGILQETDTYEAMIDFTENSFFTESFDFLDSLGASTSTDFGEGLTFGDSIYTEGTSLEIPLGDYRFDLVIYDGSEQTKYLMPLQVANLLFVGQVYYDVYYNGEAVYGVDSYQFLDGDAIVNSAVKKSPSNNLNASVEERLATYDFIVLAFDYFYGLKDVNGVTTYYDVFSKYVDDIAYGPDLTHYEAIFNLTYSMDDMHTYHITTGFYTAATTKFQLSYAQLGNRMKSYYDGYWAVEEEVESTFGTKIPSLRITPDGLTAIVTIESFDVNTPVAFKRNLDKIASEYPSVNNVVVDLSNNGGGNVGAVWRTLGYMTDDVIYYHSQNPTTKATVTYTIYDSYDKYDYNWFVLVSPITFSAANMMASTVQEQGIATVIGIKSSGGASSISGLVVPTGDVLFYSSTSVISRKLIDGTFESIEYGIVPDIAFSEYSQLYDLEYIQNVVNLPN